MSRPARNPVKDKLVSARLLSFTYGQLGIIEFAGGLFVYCVILAYNGFMFWDLLWLQSKWEDSAINDLEDSFGQEWVILHK